MSDVEYQTRMLIREIKKCNEYNQYQRLKQKLSKEPELLRKADIYRKTCFYLQNKPGEPQDQVALEALYEQNKELLCQSDVQEYLMTEQRLCRMAQRVIHSLTETLDFDVDLSE